MLLPLPERDSDPSEVAITWQVLAGSGHEVVFATQTGAAAQSDEVMLTGRGLGLFGRVLGANADARAAYAALAHLPPFRAPERWETLRARDYDALFLPGGHRARGMRAYLESAVLQQLVVDFFADDKPVAAICHGVLLAARSIDPRTRRSVLYGRRTTALTWQLERAAWRIGRIARFWDPDYYRTYREAPDQPPGYMSVQAEVTRALERPSDFEDVPRGDPDYRRKTAGLARDTLTDATPAFVVQHGRYCSGRWPGDVHTLATTFDRVLRTLPGSSR
ncbi:MAG TPA: type 1 glutamine amidotransferase domain-containing protein [Candidatus Sulfotelmatobacter sp.]|nr:type 1 glutamine amidotransferase domain-containing protein [Candidatus Sulfotelmatobacter sp.]